ncbi:MAG: tetratricopeptide repeat protein, partial [Acidimicrobiales bacterium]
MRDQLDNAMTGAAAAAGRYDEAIDALLRFHPRVVSAAQELRDEAPDAPMGHALWAYLHLLSTDADDLPAARAAATALTGLEGNEREAGHAAAVAAWAAGDWDAAAARLDAVLERWPADLLALAIGHQLDFFLGDAANLADRPGRSLPELDPAHPHTAFVRGMHAFGLEERGSYGAAEAAGLAAVSANADDVWALHAVVHVYEMRGRVDEGLRFLAARERDWGEGNLFTVHNWWHRALYCLEAGAVDAALAVYDAHIHHPGAAGVPLELLDASALLWRLLLDGIDVGGRFDPLADAWAAKAAESWYVFNDLHAVMAFAGAGRLDDAEAVLARLAAESTAAAGRPTNARMTAEIGLAACRAALAFVEGRYDDVVAGLAPIRRTLHRFGGSHAQRDALVRTLLEAALRARRVDLARALSAERVSAREASVYGWRQRAAALALAGRAGCAALEP